MSKIGYFDLKKFAELNNKIAEFESKFHLITDRLSTEELNGGFGYDYTSDLLRMCVDDTISDYKWLMEEFKYLENDLDYAIKHFDEIIEEKGLS